MPAQKVVELVHKKLLEFGIDLNNHTMATVNDGASVMVKYGTLIEPEQQLCYAHGIHLAVCDFLYSKTSNLFEVLFPDEDEYSSDSDAHDDDTMYELNGEIDDSIPLPLLRQWIEDAISKVRRIARPFRKSPVKNSILQKYVIEEKGKDIQISGYLDEKLSVIRISVKGEYFQTLVYTLKETSATI